MRIERGLTSGWLALGLAAVLTGCGGDEPQEPEWERVYNNGTPDSSYDALKDIHVDGAGDVIAVGTSNRCGGEYCSDYREEFVQLVKYNDAGNRLWVSDFVPAGNSAYVGTSLVDNAGNTYVSGGDLGEQSFLAKVDPWGNVLWQTSFGTGWEISMAMANNQLVVTGSDTWLFNTDGQELSRLGHEEQRLSALAVDGLGSIYLTNDSWTRQYSVDGDLVWSMPTPNADRVYSRPNIAVSGSGDVYVATVLGSNFADRAQVYKVESGGSLAWVREFDHPDVNDSSNGIPQIALNSAGQVIAAFSTREQRRLIALHSDGTQSWQSTSNEGEIRDLHIDGADDIYITGPNVAEKFDSQGNLIFQTAEWEDQSVGGGLALAGGYFYVGAGVIERSLQQAQMYVAKFAANPDR